jgi:purine-binding chemotaxis protein CheW
LGQERYGIEVSYVREVHPLKELTLVPCTPSFVLGIMSLRGQILSVIDIRQFFDLPQKGMTDDAKVVVVHTDKTEVGILADLVQGVRKTAFDELQAGLPTLTGIPQDYLKGITKDRMVILNVDRLLSDDRFIVYETVGD